MVYAKRHAAYMFHISQQRRSCDNPGKAKRKQIRGEDVEFVIGGRGGSFFVFVSLDKQCIWPYVPGWCGCGTGGNTSLQLLKVQYK